jgi:TatA/E family protein of Tat protein translocase
MLPGVPLFLPVGGIEMGIILLLIVFFVGADKIPKVSRALGESTNEFKRGRKQAERQDVPRDR